MEFSSPYIFFHVRMLKRLAVVSPDSNVSAENICELNDTILFFLSPSVMFCPIITVNNHNSSLQLYSITSMFFAIIVT